MARIAFIGFAALAVLVVTGCTGMKKCPAPPDPLHSIGCHTSSAPLRLDRGDWMVSQRTAVWKVLESQAGTTPRHIGYLTQRNFRQMRGGPTYAMYVVTTLNRREEIGRIDQMGRAYRYDPRRNAGFDEVDIGVTTREVGVATIFKTDRQVSFEETTERRIAFELLDEDGSGYLESTEMVPYGDRLRSGDRDRDGRVDYAEFDLIDVL